MIRRLCLVGTGLIGGSLALALRAAGFKGEIVGYGRSEDHLRRAVERGIIDGYQTDAAKAVAGCDLVLLAVPMGAMRAVLRSLAPGLDDNCIVTDAGSVKGDFVAAAREILPSLKRLVPGHPIAGTEQSGVEAGFAELYRNRRVILTPVAETDADAVDTVRWMWEQAGAEVELLDVRHHDRLLAATSHLPHMLAFGLVDALARRQESEEIFRYAAGGFRDFTRIASSDPVMWRDICISNREALLDVMHSYKDDLALLTRLIRDADGDGLLELFSRAKRARDSHC